MTVDKALVGKEVKITWRDPVYSRGELREARHGLSALARWVEYGVIESVEEGVVKIYHSLGANPEHVESGKYDEGCATDVPEALIESLFVFGAGEQVGG